MITATDVSAVDPTTTLEQDRAALGHRRINMVWEITQAFIAISVVTANLLAAFYLSAANTVLSNAFFLVIGFYFGRTNHTRSSGGSSQIGR